MRPGAQAGKEGDGAHIDKRLVTAIVWVDIRIRLLLILEIVRAPYARVRAPRHAQVA